MQQKNHAADKFGENVRHEERLAGLKKHSEEVNRIVIESLQQALLILMKKKPLEKITVSELCLKAGVSRTAFYYNFGAIGEILKRVVVDLHVELIEKIGSPFRMTTDRHWYENLFRLIAEKADTLTLIFDSGFRDVYLKYANELALHDPKVSAAKKFQRLLWIGGIVNVIVYWLDSGMLADIGELSRYCENNLVAWNY